jgi:tetratricopeptide (TPR) repeat protein
MTHYHWPVLVLLIALDLSYVGGVAADAVVDERIHMLSERIENDPGNQELRLQRSLAYVENNQAKLALADIRTAETVGDPVAAAFTHGVVLYQAGDYASARVYFDRYLQAYPLHRATLEYRARLLRDTGENRLALADYENLITLSDSLDPGYYLATARLMAGLPERGVAQALAVLDSRMAQLGPITSLQRYAIELEKNRGNFQRAIERLASLDQKLRATPQWQVQIAELLLLAGKSEEAQPYLIVAKGQLQNGRRPIDQELLQTIHRLQEQTQHAAYQACGSAHDPKISSGASPHPQAKPGCPTHAP